MATSKASQQASKVPPHLRRFHRLPLTTEPKLAAAKTQYSHHIHSTASGGSVELCPPHWRLKPKMSLRSKLKSLVLKEPLHDSRDRTINSSLSSLPPHRPGMMRMKDSDDYITARAANPRTGMISPSIDTSSPRTPESPGEALKLSRDVSLSPTREMKAEHPSRTRHNALEGREINHGRNRWRVDVDGWISDSIPHPVSPRETNDVGGRLYVITSGRNIVLPDDHFVVHMPTAREPQPFLYPGRTAAEIQAFEQYVRRARMVSGQGDDGRRVLGGGDPRDMRQVSREETIAHRPNLGHGGEGNNVHEPHSGCQLHETARAGGIGSQEFGMETSFVLKHGDVNGHAMPYSDASETSKAKRRTVAAKFAPFLSPRNPHVTIRRFEDQAETLVKTLKVPGAFDDLTPCREHAVIPTCLRRKALKSGCSPSGHTHGPSLDLVNTSSNFADLGHLARVRLVQPTFAALPTVQHGLGKRDRVSGTKREQSSRGCDQRTEIRDAVHSRKSNAGDNAPYPRWSLFESKKTDHGEHIDSEEWPTVNDLFMQIMALKPILTFTTKALAVTAAITMVWRLGVALMQVVEALLWPLAIPFKILRLVASGSD